MKFANFVVANFVVCLPDDDKSESNEWHAASLGKFRNSVGNRKCTGAARYKSDKLRATNTYIMVI